MTREAKIRKAQRLRAEGLLMREIGERMGVSKGCVARWLNPEKAREWNRRDNARRAPAKRAWDHEHRAACSTCGGPLREGSARSDGSPSRSMPTSGLCWSCRQERSVALIDEMVRLRNEEGLSNRAIADRLGIPVNTVAGRLHDRRRSGEVVARDPYMENRSTWKRAA